MGDIEIINNLAQIFTKYNRPGDFLQIMFVYKNVKPGFFPQFKDEPEVVPIFKKEVLPLLKELGFYVSFKHGGYVTLSHHLYKSWNGLGFHFKNKNLGPHYLGYPECCQIRFNSFTNLISLSLYYTLKKVIVDHDTKSADGIKQLISDMIELEEYQPCVVRCKETHNRANSLRRVRGMFIKLLPRTYLIQKKIDVKSNLIFAIGILNEPYVQSKIKKQLKLLKKSNMRELFSLDDDFFNVIEEFLSNPGSKKKLLAEMEVYLKHL